MRLVQADLSPEKWEAAGITLPKFDRAMAKQAALISPKWLHIGAGNILRAFPAAVLQRLLEQGLTDAGMIVAEGFDTEIIHRVVRPHDGLTLLVTLNADGSTQKRVIGSIVEGLELSIQAQRDWDRLVQIFCNPSLQMVSLTITEKGYAVADANGQLYPHVKSEIAAGPNGAQSTMGLLTALCYQRYLAGAQPLALVSMDNCSHNGSKLFAAVQAYADGWVRAGLANKGFVDYISNPAKVSFPWSMIDKITPRPDEGVRAMLEQAGFEDAEVIITEKNTYTAAFVNAEQSEYLVIEDAFANGRPSLEKGGVIFTDRATVDKVEKMKVCTCLNPLHTALAIFGCLLGYTRISEEMRDKDLVQLVRRIGYIEGLPVVEDPQIIDPKAFLDETLNIRFPNPFMPDTPQRIATDTSQKLPIRFGQTIKAYMQRSDLDTSSLTGIALVLAGWCRYLLGVDDAGKPFAPSSDPLLPMLQQRLSQVKLGEPVDAHQVLAPLLSDASIFGVDLYQAGLGERVEGLFAQMIQAPGAVRRALRTL